MFKSLPLYIERNIITALEGIINVFLKFHIIIYSYFYAYDRSYLEFPYRVKQLDWKYCYVKKL